MRTTPIDLSQLPAPDIVDALDYETLLDDRKARLARRELDSPSANDVAFL